MKYLPLIAALLCGCAREHNETAEAPHSPPEPKRGRTIATTLYSASYGIIEFEHDGCLYLCYDHGGLIHKANCTNHHQFGEANGKVTAEKL